MGGDGNQGGADKLKWAEKIEISVIDPPTIREGRVGGFVKHIRIGEYQIEGQSYVAHCKNYIKYS